jgi:tRNA-(ms[2]io[6]A)-hydroxylase
MKTPAFSGLSELLPLRAATPAGWAAFVASGFDDFLLDHASCERKAAMLCLSLVAQYSDRPFLVEPLVTLAREELDHFGQVYRLLNSRGLILGQDEKDPYVNELLKTARSGPLERLLDRLALSALIEARGCERFGLLAEALTDPELRAFYQTLSRAEAGHYRVFIRIAERFFPPAEVEAAVDRLAPLEA